MIAQYPLEIEAYARLANLLRGEEKFPEAIEVLKQAMVIDSGDKSLYNSLGSVYTDMGRHDEANAMLQRYVQLAPDEPNLHDSLALAYHWAGRYEEAIAEYNRALQLKPNFEIAIVHLGNVYFQQGRYRAAIDELQKYIKSAPSDAERARGWADIAYVELRQGNIPAAERTANTAARLWSGPVDETFFIAIAKGDVLKARQINGQIEHSQNNNKNRGSRQSSRPMWVRRGLYALKSNSPAERSTISKKP